MRIPRLLWVSFLAAAMFAVGAWMVWPSSSQPPASDARSAGLSARTTPFARAAPIPPTPADDLSKAALLDALARSDDPGAPAALAFAAEDPRLGHRAAAALGQVHDHAAASALAQLATGDGPPLLRANAVQALAASGSHAQAPSLMKLLADPSQPVRVRIEAALTLGALHEQTAVPAMTQLLRGVDEAHAPAPLRLAVEQALASIASPNARAALGGIRPSSEEERRVLTALIGRSE